MRNICFLNTTSFWGGGEKIHLEYGLKLQERGYQVYVAANSNGELFKRAVSKKLSVFDITLKNLSFLNLYKYWRLYRFFKSKKIDTVIISTSHDSKVGANAAKLSGVKRIVLYRALAAPVKNRWFNRYLYKRVFTHVLANSLESRRTMVQHLNVIKQQDIEVVYQGLDLKLFNNKVPKRIEFPREKIIIGNAGRLTPQKAQHHLIEIARRLKAENLDFKLVIAGQGKLERELNTLIRSHSLEDEVQLLGFVEDVESFMESIDIFAFTSTFEGFGYVLAEAMLAKKPIVAFNLTSNPELVKHGQNGYLVEYDDLEGFTQNLIHLARDEKLRMRLGCSGKEFVESNFSLDKIMDRFISCLLKPTTKTAKS